MMIHDILLPQLLLLVTIKPHLFVGNVADFLPLLGWKTPRKHHFQIKQNSKIDRENHGHSFYYLIAQSICVDLYSIRFANISK